METRIAKGAEYGRLTPAAFPHHFPTQAISGVGYIKFQIKTEFGLELYFIIFHEYYGTLLS